MRKNRKRRRKRRRRRRDRKRQVRKKRGELSSSTVLELKLQSLSS